MFTFPGHSYRPGAAAAAAADEATALAKRPCPAAAGFEGGERSGGSTPSARLARPGALSELRPGVYALYDAQQVELGIVSMNEVALMVAATVVSRPAPGRIVLDAGSKVLGRRPARLGQRLRAPGGLARRPDHRAVGASRRGRH